MLVALHGFTETDLAWREVLSPSSLDVLSAVAGSWLEPVPQGATVASCAADLAEHIRHRQSQATLQESGTDPEPIDLIGYSLGGRIALRLALDYPDLVKRLVLVGAHAGIRDPEAQAARLKRDRNLADVLMEDGIGTFVAWWESQPVLRMVKPPAAGLIETLRSRRLNQDPEGLAASLLAYGQGTQEPVWDRLGDLTAQCLLLVGEHDSTFRKPMQQMVGLIPQAHLTVIPGVGHAPHREVPQQLTTLIEQFLTDESLAGSSVLSLFKPCFYSFSFFPTS